MCYEYKMDVQKTTPEIVDDEANQVITDFIGILCPHEKKVSKSNSNKVCDSKMKIYRQDGTYQEKDNDPTSSFGWMCSDFIVDENTPEFEMKNLCTRFFKSPKSNATPDVLNSNKNLACRCTDRDTPHTKETESCELWTQNYEPTKIKATITDTFTSSDKFLRSESLVDSGRSTDNEEVVKKYYEVKPDIKMARIQSTQKTIESPIGPDGKHLKYRLGIDWEKPPSGEELATLLNPYCPKSKVLLSILHNSRYQKVIKEPNHPANFTSLIDSRDFKFLPSNERGFEEIVLKEILDYRSSKEDNKLSIMTEIVLADMKCDIDDVIVKDKSVNDTILTDSGNFSNSTRNSTHLDNYDICRKNISDIDQSRSELFRSMGLSDTFDRSLESYSDECQGIRAQLGFIKKAFQDQEDKTDLLVEHIRSLSKELEEVTTLDDYLHLLEGNLDKVKNKIEAFRMFCPKADIEGNNFII